MNASHESFTAVIPIKPSELAKSRLDLHVRDRSRLATAFAADVLDAVAASRRVEAIVIVTARGDLAEQARQFDAVVLRDRPLVNGNGLNHAIRLGSQWASSRRAHHPVVVVPSDLPCLNPETLDATLDALQVAPTAFVPDRSGSGTTLLSASQPLLLRPSYGHGSSGRHSARGFRCVHDVDPRVRQDVDTTHDLASAITLGIGPATRAALVHLTSRLELAGANTTT